MAPVSAATARAPASQPMSRVATPGQHNIEEVSAFLKLPAKRIVKTLMVVTGDGREVFILLRGDQGARAVLESAAQHSAVAMPSAALDVDTPAELARLERTLG